MLQYDIKNAFVYVGVDKEIYVIQPTGFAKGDKVCKLNKALYGLKQLSRLWYTHLKSVLLNLGFIVLSYDEVVFIYLIHQVILCCYVDDIIAVGLIKAVINKLINKAFEKLKI